MTAGTFLTGAFKYGAQIFDRMAIEVLISTENADDFEKNMISIQRGRAPRSGREASGRVHHRQPAVTPGQPRRASCRLVLFPEPKQEAKWPMK